MTKENNDYPLIMEKYPALKSLPYIKLAKLPVPIEKMNALEKELDFDGIYIKREDYTHDVYGGNKTRKYEFQLGDILKKKKNKIVTFGGIGSNQVLANAIYCKQFGLESIGFLDYQILTQYVRNNLLLDHYYGSKLYHYKSDVSMALSMIWYLITHPKSYLVWAGTSTPLGTIGFVDAMFEIKKQVEEGSMPEPDYIFVADGSTGTTAGLVLGSILAGLKTKIYGVLVTSMFVASKKKVISLSYKTYKLLKKHEPNLPKIIKKDLEEKLTVLKDFHGGEYGLPTKEGVEAIELIKKCHNIELDTTYTGKACSAMIAFIKEKKDEIQGKKILFYNTLNTIDHSKEISQVDYHDLPKNLHKYFDGTVPLNTECVTARHCNDDIV